MNLALKDIRHNLGRFALTSIGVGMLLMIVMGMGGIYRGIVEDATLLVDQMQVDLWVVQKDTRGPFSEVSRISPNLVERCLVVPGVLSSKSFIYHTIQRQSEGLPLRIAVMGIDWPLDNGNWIPLDSGRSFRQGHYEMIANKSLGLKLNQKISLGSHEYEVVGISSGMISSAGDGIGFFSSPDAIAIQTHVPSEAKRLERQARINRAEKFEKNVRQPSAIEFAALSPSLLPASARSRLSAILLKLKPGWDPEKVVSIISKWGDVSVYTAKQQNEFLLKGRVEKSKKQIGLFRTLLTTIAGIIMALILYTLTLDKIQSIALLKLIGAPNSTIFLMVLQQAIVLGSVGFIVAYFAGQQLFPKFPRRVIIVQEDLIHLAVIVLVISVVSSLLGIWKAMKVTPNEALA